MNAADPAPEPVQVMRRGAGPFPGVRVGRTAAYEFVVPSHLLRPGASGLQRAFLLLDAAIQLNQPVVFPEEQADWWYIDLVRIDEDGTRISVQDHYIDVIVGPPGHPYRLLDLDEFGDAIRDGHLSLAEALAGLTAMQRFLDCHLNRRHEVLLDWPDFPPAAILPLLDMPIPPLSGAPADAPGTPA